MQSGVSEERNMIKEPTSSSAFSVSKNAKDTFREIYMRFEGLYEDDKLKEAVSRNYELCDMNFMEMLADEINDCKAEGADMEAKQYVKLQEMIQEEMSSRIGTAQERLQVR